VNAVIESYLFVILFRGGGLNFSGLDCGSAHHIGSRSVIFIFLAKASITAIRELH
jgi:hypothetical protein